MSAKQGNYLVPFLYGLWYDVVLDWGLNPGPPALDTSTLPLGYRGGGAFNSIFLDLVLMIQDRKINVMDQIRDRKSFEVGGHWPLWRG